MTLVLHSVLIFSFSSQWSVTSRCGVQLPEQSEKSWNVWCRYSSGKGKDNMKANCTPRFSLPAMIGSMKRVTIRVLPRWPFEYYLATPLGGCYTGSSHTNLEVFMHQFCIDRVSLMQPAMEILMCIFFSLHVDIHACLHLFDRIKQTVNWVVMLSFISCSCGWLEASFDIAIHILDMLHKTSLVLKACLNCMHKTSNLLVQFNLEAKPKCNEDLQV